jgi:sulfatase modifying factor 1
VHTASRGWQRRGASDKSAFGSMQHGTPSLAERVERQRVVRLPGRGAMGRLGLARARLGALAPALFFLLLGALPHPGEGSLGSELEPRAWSRASLPHESVVPVVDGSSVRLRSPLAPMVRIPAGRFVMGSDEQDVVAALADCVREPYGNRCTPSIFGDEMPERVIRLSSYWLDRHEVSVAEYERCVALGRCRERPSNEGTRRFEHSHLPVSMVSWDDARDYCAFRGLRLPTEAEFERAARGARGRRYPWGELFNRRAANHGRFGWDVTDSTDGFAELAPIGSFSAGVTPDGIHDLAGNVAEWVQDRYVARYDPGDRVDPQGPGVGSASVRVVRGGSYTTGRSLLRGAARSFAEPSERRPSLGFRCARSER